MHRAAAHFVRSEIDRRAQLRPRVRMLLNGVEPFADRTTRAFILALHGQQPPSHLAEWVHPLLLASLWPWLESPAAPAPRPAPLKVTVLDTMRTVESPAGLADCACIAIAGRYLYTVMWRMEATTRTEGNLTRFFWEGKDVAWERH